MITLRRLHQNKTGDLLACLSGALLTLSFAPFSCFPFAIISSICLLWLWLDTAPARATWRGWLYGLGFFGTSVSWVFISIHRFGYAPLSISFLITSLFIGFLALFPALHGYLLARYFRRADGYTMICAFPSIGVLIEYLRTALFGGFPWVLLGDSQIHAPLKGLAPLMGVYGVSFAILLSAGLILTATNTKNKESRRQCLIAVVCLWAISAGLSIIPWTHPAGSPLQVSLVQGNIPQSIKWDSHQLIANVKHYESLTEPHWNSDIIVWPEAAIPISLQQTEGLIEVLDEKAKRHHASLILGIPVQNFPQDNFYNAVIALGTTKSAYLKHRLVPFGEYTPEPKLFTPLLSFFHIPMSNSIPDTRPPKPLIVNGVEIATFICYEIIYPEWVAQYGEKTGLLLTVSDDSWFGDSLALAQHLESAEMRSLEMGRPGLFVSNTGLTAIIRPNGDLQRIAPAFQSVVLTDHVQPVVGLTPWQERKSLTITLLPLMLIIVAIRFRKQKN